MPITKQMHTNINVGDTCSLQDCCVTAECAAMLTYTFRLNFLNSESSSIQQQSNTLTWLHNRHAECI